MLRRSFVRVQVTLQPGIGKPPSGMWLGDLLIPRPALGLT